MSRISKILIVLIIALLTTVAVAASYKPTNLDTKLPPIEVSYDIEKPSEVEEIYENDTFIYYYKDDRDVLILHDKRNAYTWKTGLDIAASKEVKAALRKDEPLGYEPLEDKMNQTFTGIANSLLTLEYYDDSNNIKRLSSAGEGVTSSLLSVSGEPDHFVLEVSYEDIRLSLNLHLFLTEQGYDVKIYDQEILGEDKNILAALVLNPFLGASGGRYQLYDPETGKHGEKINKPEIPGYVFVPDGSGALIRFNDYNVSLKSYEASVYGQNPAKMQYNTGYINDSYKPFKEPLMPLYGIAHGDQQAAFVGYATKGDEHMEVIVVPEENTTLYTWAYPRFVYNQLYHQIFNKRGDGYFTLFEAPDQFDIEFSYDFLSGDGETGYPADYVGMALDYKDYLLEQEILTKKTFDYDKIPMRLDFIMSDQKKSVIGYENAVTTTAEEVEAILSDFSMDGDYNINVGLHGWQDGGVTVAKPWKTDFISAIGRKSDFRELITTAASKGIDVSFVTDYASITEEQVSYLGNASKHTNKWYIRREMFTDVPFDSFSFAKPQKSAQWLVDQTEDLSRLPITSHTVEGISSVLLSEHGNKPMTEEEVIALYQAKLSRVGSELQLNLKMPNQYLWQHTDRFLQSPVYPTQFLIETDTVPFLQIILSGTMEVYAPYANFSFSDERDILRMIDYNIYPSFILTKGASYLLSTTNSLDYYSTEYDQYEPVIQKVYSEVNDALGQVLELDWVNRETAAPGIIVNSYSDGTQILINFTDDLYEHEGQTVEALSYKIIR